MKVPGLRDWMLPAALLGFAAPAVTFLPTEVFELGRWAGAGALLVFALASGVPLRAAPVSVLIPAAAYVTWCVMSGVWSLVPDLTIPKALALTCVLPAFILGGVEWPARGQRDNVFGFLWPFAILAAAAAVFARDVSLASADIELYQGASGGPNVLGFLMASATPVVLWRLYADWASPKRRLIWLGLLAYFLAFLYLSNARASYLLFAGIAGGFLIGLRPRVAVPMVAFGVALILSVVVFAPDIAESFSKRNVYKYSDAESGGVFANREREWAESYDAAVEGGWLGLGYGVSTGEGEFFGGYTAVDYGREKGNSQLAMIEEIGIIGLVLFLVLMLAVFLELWSAFASSRDHHDRMQMGLLIGSFIGITLHGIFEAWWVSPGSVEFAYFWAVSGVGLGLARKMRERRPEATSLYRDQPQRA